MGINALQYHDEEAARMHLEAILWPKGPICPREDCGVVNNATKLEPQMEGKRDGKTVQFKTHARVGTYKCRKCGQQFSVTVGTIFEDSKIALHKWLLAIHLMCSSKKGMSAHQLWRNLWGVNEETGKPNGSYRTAWFMAHRIRWALGQEPLKSKLAGIVEIDETYIGPKRRVGKHVFRGGDPSIDRSPFADKAPVVAILERNGDVRSRSVDRVTADNLKPIVEENVEKGAILMTDSATHLKFPVEDHQHHKVNHHAKEYVRHEQGLTVTTNTVEGYFAIIKRGNYGIYHHWDRKYMDQYLREFDFRYNVRRMNDDDRAVLAVQKTSGKRLMLKEPKSQI